MKTSGRKQKLIDINITPFVDIMLVLLIIFMVTAPMITNEIQVTLPSSAIEKPSHEMRFVNVNIDDGGGVTVDKKKHDIQAFEDYLQGFKKEDHIHIYADKNTKYEAIIKVLEVLAKGGFTNTSFMVEGK